MSKVIEDEKLKMVGWYDPSQLLDTAKKNCHFNYRRQICRPEIGNG